jgi:ankyrin repeat protein
MDARDKVGRTPLMCSSPWLETFEVLLEAGADVGARCPKLWSPLHWGCHEFSTGHYTGIARKSKGFRYINMLLRHGAMVDSQDSEGNTPLHILLRELERDKRNDVQCLIIWISGLLIKAGASLELKNISGKTPAQRISDMGYQDMDVKDLLAAWKRDNDFVDG